ncbi:hypothetical protein ACJIZ3_004270 [Penstemon smallii]|uniref:Protein GAMETE EXPRESSED 1 n=1 Tax=Penstemon smallii TaxID=265156 RepID=A0ABD3S1P2_9LAMI
MDHHIYHHCLCLFSILLLFSQTCLSWSWFFSSNKEETQSNDKIFGKYKDVVSEFSMEYLNDKKGIELIKSAKSKMVDPNSCWQTAYQNLFQGCSKTLPGEELRSRLAWHLSDCFQQHTGRLPFPYCDAKSTMKICLKNLDEDAHQIYLKYFLETNSICHHLQTGAFKKQTERMVNELKTSAEFAEEKLENIEQHEELLIQNAKQVQDSLSSLDLKSQRVAKTTKNIEDRVNSALRYSESIYEQINGIAVSQVELSKSQAEMKENLEEETSLFKDSFDNLGQEVNNLRKEAVVIEKEIERVGDVMFLEMRNLQGKADEIGNMAGMSLAKQKQIFDGQTEALTSLDFLSKFQSEALEESRENLRKLVEFEHKQQEELLQRQKQLHQTHDYLVENSKLILATQKAFESKQASMFVSIDKLFTLHTSMLFESRVFIALFMYSIAIFIIYMLTSIKLAYNVRHRFYIGLCFTFLIEISILWYISTDYEQQGRMINMRL